MAASSSVTADWTTCPICLEVFDNPKALPCIHGFCLKCLQIYFKEKSPGDTVSCPMCRKEFKIPPDGIGGLQHHFFIQYLVDARNASTKPTDEVACEVCSAENETGAAEEMPTATMYCFDCRQRLCERCSRPHRRMTSGTHLVRALGSGLEQEVIQLRGSSCEKHKDKRVELYCYQCDENICLMCSAVKHRNHESGEIPEVADSFRSRIDDDNKQVLPNVSVFRQQLERTEEEVTKLLSQVENVEKMIVDAGEAIKRVVDNQISEYLLELQSVKSDSTKQADFVQEQLQLALVAMESFHTYSRELLDKGRPSDITRAASELHKRATELLGNDVTSVHYCPPHVTFAPADVTKLTPLQLIGNLTINHLGKVPGK